VLVVLLLLMYYILPTYFCIEDVNRTVYRPLVASQWQIQPSGQILTTPDLRNQATEWPHRFI